MTSTEGRAGYYRLVASGHGAALAAASQHALAVIAKADPEVVASAGTYVGVTCGHLIALADLLTVVSAEPEPRERPSLRPKRTRGELQDEAVRILAEHKAATGKQMSSKNLAKSLTLAYAVALEIRAEIRDRTGEVLAAGQRVPPSEGRKADARDAQGHPSGARRAREADDTTTGKGARI